MLKGHGTLKTLLGRSVGGSNKRQRRSDEAEDVVGTGVEHGTLCTAEEAYVSRSSPPARSCADKEEGKALHKCKKTQSTLFGWKQPPKPPAAKRCGGQTVEKKNVAEASTSKPSTQPAASNNTVWKFTARKGKSRRDILQVQVSLPPRPTLFTTGVLHRTDHACICSHMLWPDGFSALSTLKQVLRYRLRGTQMIEDMSASQHSIKEV